MFRFFRLAKEKLRVMQFEIDCLQSAFSLKIHLVLDLIQRDCKPRCYYIGIEASGYAARVLRFCA